MLLRRSRLLESLPSTSSWEPLVSCRLHEYWHIGQVPYTLIFNIFLKVVTVPRPPDPAPSLLFVLLPVLAWRSVALRIALPFPAMLQGRRVEGVDVGCRTISYLFWWLHATFMNTNKCYSATGLWYFSHCLSLIHSALRLEGLVWWGKKLWVSIYLICTYLHLYDVFQWEIS